jgi:phage terminase large subunit
VAEIIIPYKPRPEQQVEHDRLKRFNVLVCHRRWGKTVFAVNQLIQDVMTCPLKMPRGSYVAPLFKQAKAVAWDYLKEFSRVIPGTVFNEAELRADYPNGARIRLFGADNPDSMRGLYHDSVVLDEVAQMAPRAWSEVIRPALSDRLVEGVHEPRAIFIGTPQGPGMFKRLYDLAGHTDNWYRAMHKASTSGVIPNVELAQVQKEMTEREYDQEFECSFTAAIVGAFYGKEMQAALDGGRIGAVPHDKTHQVITAWDIGIADSTAIWFIQRIGRELHCIDYEEYTNLGLPDIIAHLDTKPYKYEQHIGPHDLNVRELGTGMTRKRQAANLGVRFTVAPLQPVIDGIEAVRGTISRMWFDRENCELGINCLTLYRNALDDKRGIFKPLHDWSSHGADAMRYFCSTKSATSEWTELPESIINTKAAGGYRRAQTN